MQASVHLRKYSTYLWNRQTAAAPLLIVRDLWDGFLARRHQAEGQRAHLSQIDFHASPGILVISQISVRLPNSEHNYQEIAAE